MAGVLQVRNWDRYQHYKDRCPPWIKLSTSTFQDYEFGKLRDASKLLAICIWTLAARTKTGTVPNDLDWIVRQGNLGTDIVTSHLQELIIAGFLVADSNVLADCEQSACSETEGETEQREKKAVPSRGPKSYPVAFEELWSQAAETGRLGNSIKGEAFTAWTGVGRPTDDVIARWKQYLASLPDYQTTPKHFGRWLRARGHEQEYAAAKRTGTARCTWHAKNGRGPSRYPTAACPDCKEHQARTAGRASEPTPIADALPDWAQVREATQTPSLDELQALRGVAK